MTKAIGIRFKPGGKICDFDAGGLDLKWGDPVIVETEQGLALGRVASLPVERDLPPDAQPLKRVSRPATPEDQEQQARREQQEKSAFTCCQQAIRDLGLAMNLFAVESAFEGGKLTFYFTSEGRIDFRQLVKHLVRELGQRVEMRQVGIRNKTKMCGGLGRCGRELCCATFIEKFGPVSIRMAKDQGLSLNPTKISGQCGRLMCCLTYEHETYLDLKKHFPKIGKTVTTPEGRGKVIRHNALGSRVAVRLENGPEIEVELGALTDG